MAKQIDDFSDDMFQGGGRSGFGGERYDWATWLATADTGKPLLLEQSDGKRTKHSSGNGYHVLPEDVTTAKDFETTVPLLKNRIMVKGRTKYLIARFSDRDSKGTALKNALIFRYYHMTPEQRREEDARRKEAKLRAAAREAAENGEDKDEEEGEEEGNGGSEPKPTPPAKPTVAANAPTPPAKPEPKKAEPKKAK